MCGPYDLETVCLAQPRSRVINTTRMVGTLAGKGLRKRADMGSIRMNCMFFEGHPMPCATRQIMSNATEAQRLAVVPAKFS